MHGGKGPAPTPFGSVASHSDQPPFHQHQHPHQAPAAQAIPAPPEAMHARGGDGRPPGNPAPQPWQAAVPPPGASPGTYGDYSGSRGAAAAPAPSSFFNPFSMPDAGIRGPPQPAPRAAAVPAMPGMPVSRQPQPPAPAQGNPGAPAAVDPHFNPFTLDGFPSLASKPSDASSLAPRSMPSAYPAPPSGVGYPNPQQHQHQQQHQPQQQHQQQQQLPMPGAFSQQYPLSAAGAPAERRQHPLAQGVPPASLAGSLTGSHDRADAYRAGGGVQQQQQHQQPALQYPQEGGAAPQLPWERRN
ncbi:hypothetical protein DIPPA_13645 [Diplonema papillatum]|nr:hypothetical protein DIPPA_13645 [Diplonema papillatum]